MKFQERTRSIQTPDLNKNVEFELKQHDHQNLVPQNLWPIIAHFTFFFFFQNQFVSNSESIAHFNLIQNYNSSELRGFLGRKNNAKMIGREHR